jgi:hypothetical protein
LVVVAVVVMALTGLMEAQALDLVMDQTQALVHRLVLLMLVAVGLEITVVRGIT